MRAIFGIFFGVMLSQRNIINLVPGLEVVCEPQPVKEAPKSTPHEFYDTTMLLFPQKKKKTSVDDQFGKFIEVIKKLLAICPYVAMGDNKISK